MLKKIFIAAEIFPPAIGGPATYTVELANALNQRGFKVRILCYGKPNKKILDQGIKINWVSNQWPTFVKYALYFKKLLFFSLSYEKIYAMGPVASGLPAALVKKITGKKLIIKIVGDYAWEQAFNSNQTEFLLDDFVDQAKQTGKIGRLQKIERQVCQEADLIVTPSEYLKNIVKKWGIVDKKTKVIYNAVNTKNINPFDKKNHHHIISVGRLVPWKGFATLIKIMPELLQTEPNFNLKIFGDGPDKEKLSQLIKELNLEKKIIIASVSHRDLMVQLANAEIFVLNTGYEGLSHTVLEAFAAFTPVITTNVGGNPELIQNNENGILIEYNNSEQLKNAILKLYQEPALRKKIVENSNKNLEKFTFEKMINQTILALEML